MLFIWLLTKVSVFIVFFFYWICFFVCFFFFFFSSRRRHTRCREVSWARRCVQETGYQRRVHGIDSKGLTSSEKNSSINTTLLNSDTFSNLEKSIFDVVSPALRYLINKVHDSYDSRYSSEITKRIITYIIFLLCFFFAYISFWSPFINKLCDEIWRTRSMLTLIPYDICKNIQNIKHYLSQQEKVSSSQQQKNVFAVTVSYTHLTLPTILLVQISVVAVSFKKKTQIKQKTEN
eukprot:TRINITY_DN24613_c0_g1_i2.p1 TRINITY_DN24613_c0_g1~~TRINITY_DN24613_c0_g1_i2.p1  ORF type:complete len:234 (-),score=55.10 TRINITY_DN24613_c0_g1_i2:50-751(-)